LEHPLLELQQKDVVRVQELGVGREELLDVGQVGPVDLVQLSQELTIQPDDRAGILEQTIWGYLLTY
jgi:hypothetical protein